MMETITRRLPDTNARRCAFTGYRPMKMPFGYDEQREMAQDFKKRLHNSNETLIQQGYMHIISLAYMSKPAEWVFVNMENYIIRNPHD